MTPPSNKATRRDLISLMADDFAAIEAADLVAYLPDAADGPDVVDALLSGALVVANPGAGPLPRTVGRR